MANKACNEVVTVANMPKTVFDMISAMQNKYADRVAFRYVEGKDTVVEKTYAQYVQDIRKATGYLQQELGEPKGKKIVILSRTNYEYGAVVFGTMMAGAVIVTLNQGKTWAELEYELGMVEPDLIFNDGIDYGYRAQLEALYGARLRPMDAWTAAPEAEMVNRIDHEGLLMLMFTSGTTGRSKGVMLSEKNYFTACQMYIDGLKSVLDYEERLVPQYLDQTFSHFTLVPMFHLAGFICYFVYGIQGWTLNLCCDARDLRRDMSLMHSDAMSTPPVLVEMICNEVKRGHADRLNGLWNLSCSSAILDPAILSDLVKNGFYINQCYSMTELAGYGLLNVTQEGDHLRALGKPDGFCEVKVDETGEICVHGGCAYVEGKGDEIVPTTPLPQCVIVVGKPDLTFSTEKMYQRYDQVELPARADHTAEVMLGLRWENLKTVAESMGNAFEQVLMKNERNAVELMKEVMTQFGALGSCMTGSGPAVFGIFENELYARVASETLRQRLKGKPEVLETEPMIVKK